MDVCFFFISRQAFIFTQFSDLFAGQNALFIQNSFAQ